ncbi:uncharacterized protein BJ212DRAFT_820677 [Suillus subaureus]|uniref:Anaphase-promoting complex subunit 4 WD40 domain-containing protein n=1 Tax=Suillus subaureus TaxID=48587 RepID=A0A9P7JHG0_9AGAM|nr:uncharacterized protein BJ212DRAFT_820677 [Suillus subaureus]KAG1822674.1 hypothetical protein BJ212DRAFT_820677 [Suillus subaureus]
MSSPAQEISIITPHQKFEGHTDVVCDVIHLPGRQRIMTCSEDGSLRVWNLKTGKQIGDEWRDGESQVWTIALSPDGQKVIGGSNCENRSVQQSRKTSMTLEQHCVADCLHLKPLVERYENLHPTDPTSGSVCVPSVIYCDSLESRARVLCRLGNSPCF